jgi:hypothetical protein
VSLNVAMLEKVRELASGVVQARCPACAEGGNDRAGEHLRIYPDGRFGCCVYPKDSQHRKRIFALAGERQRLPPSRNFTVKVPVAKASAAVRCSIKDSLAGNGRTLRTGVSESEASEPKIEAEESLSQLTFRTLRTDVSNPRAYEQETPNIYDAHSHICKDSDKGVLSVLASDGDSNPPKKPRLPHFTPNGDLVIPYDGPARYHWWKGGQSVAETRREILERMENHASEF